MAVNSANLAKEYEKKNIGNGKRGHVNSIGQDVKEAMGGGHVHRCKRVLKSFSLKSWIWFVASSEIM